MAVHIKIKGKGTISNIDTICSAVNLLHNFSINHLGKAFTRDTSDSPPAKLLSQPPTAGQALGPALSPALQPTTVMPRLSDADWQAAT
jgi:hypothetical protein